MHPIHFEKRTTVRQFETFKLSTLQGPATNKKTIIRTWFFSTRCQHIPYQHYHCIGAQMTHNHRRRTRKLSHFHRYRVCTACFASGPLSNTFALEFKRLVSHHKYVYFCTPCNWFFFKVIVPFCANGTHCDSPVVSIGLKNPFASNFGF